MQGSFTHRLFMRSADLAFRLAEHSAVHDPAALLAALTPLLPSGRPWLRSGLERLVRACAAEADLSAFGRLALRLDIRQRLANLAAIDAAEAAAPAIARERIVAPLIITGMPRSGTTFLHRLLASDPAALAPRAWETIYPYPSGRGPDRRAARVDRQLRAFGWFAPGLRSMHPMSSTAPQECTEITAQVFRSLRYETLYRVPSYKTWLAAEGHAVAYDFHRRFLRHVQHQRGGGSGRRWVLKSPDHVFALDALYATYPDARVVFLHRDPAHVLASVARLTELLRAPFTNTVDRHGIGRQVLADWDRGARVMMQEAAAPRRERGQTLHLRYRDLIARPLETVRTLYRHFGMELTCGAEAAMAQRVAVAPRGGYGENVHDLRPYGNDSGAVSERFAGYVRLFAAAEGRWPAPAAAATERMALAPATRATRGH